jgi:hypothetical protein
MFQPSKNQEEVLRPCARFELHPENFEELGNRILLEEVEAKQKSGAGLTCGIDVTVA